LQALAKNCLYCFNHYLSLTYNFSARKHLKKRKTATKILKTL
jgi:hypothetical protein